MWSRRADPGWLLRDAQCAYNTLLYGEQGVASVSRLGTILLAHSALSKRHTATARQQLQDTCRTILAERGKLLLCWQLCCLPRPPVCLSCVSALWPLSGSQLRIRGCAGSKSRTAVWLDPGSTEETRHSSACNCFCRVCRKVQTNEHMHSGAHTSAHPLPHIDGRLHRWGSSLAPHRSAQTAVSTTGALTTKEDGFLLSKSFCGFCLRPTGETHIWRGMHCAGDLRCQHCHISDSAPSNAGCIPQFWSITQAAYCLLTNCSEGLEAHPQHLGSQATFLLSN